MSKLSLVASVLLTLAWLDPEPSLPSPGPGANPGGRVASPRPRTSRRQEGPAGPHPAQPSCPWT